MFSFKHFLSFPRTDHTEMSHHWTLHLLLATAALIVLGWMLFCAPPNMDEFLPYHPIACTYYPAAHLQTFRESCFAYRTETLWHTVYYRPYGYVGMLTAAIYYPLFRLWPQMASLYVLATFMSVAFYYGLTRLHHMSAGWVVVLLAFFPITYQMIHDTGPVRVPLLVFPLVALLARKMGTSHHLSRYLPAIGIALGMAMAVEDKPFFVLLLPGLFFYTLAFVEGRLVTFFRNNIGPLLVMPSIFAGLLALILLQKVGDHGELYYFQTLSGIGGTHSLLDILNRLAVFIMGPISYAHRNFDIDQTVLNWSIGSMLLFFVCPLIRRRHLCRTDACLVLSFLSMIAVFLMNRAVWAGHHFVFLWVPALSLYLRGFNRHHGHLMMSCLVALGLSSVVILACANVNPDDSTKRSAVRTYLSREDVASNNVINNSSWGEYYIQSLYGAHSQWVTYIDPYDANAIQKLKTIARSQGRRILNVCDDCDRHTLAIMFGAQARIQEVPLDARPWRVFRIDFNQD
jgi:hypothetical protein